MRSLDSLRSCPALPIIPLSLASSALKKKKKKGLIARIRQTAPLGATNFIKVNNQYSEVIFVVFYYFCFIANLTTSRGGKVIQQLYIFKM